MTLHPYDTIVNNLPCIVYRLDPGGNFMYLNNSVRSLGYEPKDLLDRHFSSIVVPEDLEKIQRARVMKSSLRRESLSAASVGFFDERRTGNRITRDLRVRLVHGGYRAADPVSCRVLSAGSYEYIEKEDRREFNGTVGVIRAVGDPVTDGEDAGEYARHYRSLIESTGDVVTILAPDGTVLFASPSIARVLGYGPGEFTGSNIWEYVCHEERRDVLARYRAATPGEPDFLCECRVRSADGAWRVMSTEGRVITDHRGRMLCIVAASRDVTARREADESLSRAFEFMERRVMERTVELARARDRLAIEIEARKDMESRLREAEGDYRGLVDAIDAIVLRLDTSGAIVSVNGAIEAAGGFSPADLIGRDLVDFLHPEDGAEFAALLKRARNTGMKKGAFRCEREYRMMRKDGSTALLSIRCGAVRDTAGGLVGFRCVAVDVTRLRAMEDELMRAWAFDSPGLLTGGIAHDFNNYLASIKGCLDLVRSELGPDDPNRGYLDYGNEAADMAGQLIGRLLEASPAGVPVTGAFPVGELLQKRAGSILCGSPIECRFYIHSDLRDVEADRGQISRVICNIILNARQAMPGGGAITISAENAVMGRGSSLPLDPGSYVKISIEDTGGGIPANELKRVFDPHYSKRKDGNGLGLAICHSIVRKHRGCIVAESTEGVGTAFVIYLPADEGTGDGESERAVNRAGGGGSPHPRYTV